MGKKEKNKSKFMSRIRSSISTKVAFALLIAILLVFTTACTVIYYYTKSTVTQSVEDSLSNQRDAIADQVGNMFSEKGIIVKQMATNQEFVKYLKSAESRDEATTNTYYGDILKSLDEIVKTDSSIAMAWIASNKANFLVGSNKMVSDKSFDIKNRPWYEPVLVEENVYFTPPYMDEVFGEMILSMMKPIKENGKVIGVVAIDITLDKLPELMQLYSIGESGYSFLATDDGTILYHPNSDFVLNQNIQSMPGDLGKIGQKMLEGQKGLEVAKVDDKLEYIGYTPVHNSGWSVGTAISQDEALSRLDTFTIMMTTFFSSASIILILLVAVMLKRMLRNIPVVTNVMKQLAVGDLRQEELEVKSNDEIGQLMASTNQMKQRWQEVIKEMQQVSETVTNRSKVFIQSANEVNAGSEQIATTMQELAAGSETLANNASDLSERMNAFTTKVQEANGNGYEIEEKSSAVLNMTKDGSELMQQSIQQMEKIDSIVLDSVKKVEGLDMQSKKISTLVTVIKDVADQTNLLALNAAIEAARAGEHGKGFAVVADEVRELAEQVSGSVKEITDIVNNIQKESNVVRDSLNDGYKEVEQGKEKIASTGETFEGIEKAVMDMVQSITAIAINLTEIAENTQKANESIEEIASVSEESAAGVEQVSASSQETASIMEEVAGSSEQLAKLADKLNTLVQKFKI